MGTVVESPRRQLERALGIERDGHDRRRLSAGSACLRGFTCGVRVARRDNPGHQGEVVANNWGTPRVRWDNGWFESLDADDIVAL